MQLVDFFFRLDAASHDQLFLGGTAELCNYVKRHAQQQAFGIDIGVEKGGTPGFESVNHLHGGNFRKLPPSADRNLAAFRVCREYKFVRAYLTCELFGK